MNALPFQSVRLNNAPLFHRCEPMWRWKPPPLQDYDLWLVLDGVGKMRHERQSFELSAGSSFIWFPGSQPHATHNPQHQLLVFAVHFDFLDRAGQRVLLQPSQLPPLGWRVRDIAFLRVLAERAAICAEESLPGTSTLDAAQASGLVQQMVLHLWRESTAPPQRDEAILQLCAAIRQEPDRAWTIAEMAQRAHLSRAQLSRRFQSVVGTSPMRYVIHSRLDRARQLLLETDLSISQIAMALGYRDVHFFSRQWKQQHGQAPGALRRKANL